MAMVGSYVGSMGLLVPLLNPLEFSPTAFYDARSGYGVEGAVQCGFAPGAGINNSHLIISGGPVIRIGGNTNWGGTCRFRLTQDSESLQYLADKTAATNNEFTLAFLTASQKVRFTILEATGGGGVNLDAASGVRSGVIHTISFGHSVLSGAGSGLAYLYFDDTLVLAATAAITPGSGTLALKLGQMPCQLDSVGFAPGRAFLSGDHAAFHAAGSGVSLSGLSQGQKDYFGSGAFWSFGTRVKFDTISSGGINPFFLPDFLLDETANNNTLSTVAAGPHVPYPIPGLTPSLNREDCSGQVLWLPDVAGNGNYAHQTYYHSRLGFSASGMNGGPCFVFGGNTVRSGGYYNGQWMPTYVPGRLFSGNVSYTGWCKFRAYSVTNPSYNTTHTEPMLAFSLMGPCAAGYTPQNGYRTPAGNNNYHDIIRVHLADELGYPGSSGAWSALRIDDNFQQNFQYASGVPFPATDAPKSGDVQAGVVTYDAATGRKRFYVNGRTVLNVIQTHDNFQTGNLLSGFIARQFSWGDVTQADNFNFVIPFPPPNWGGGGRAWFGEMQFMGCRAGYAANENEAAGLCNWMLANG